MLYQSSSVVSMCSLESDFLNQLSFEEGAPSSLLFSSVPATVLLLKSVLLSFLNNMAGVWYTHGNGGDGLWPPTGDMILPVSGSITFPKSSVSVNNNVLEGRENPSDTPLLTPFPGAKYFIRGTRKREKERISTITTVPAWALEGLYWRTIVWSFLSCARSDWFSDFKQSTSLFSSWFLSVQILTRSSRPST